MNDKQLGRFNISEGIVRKDPEGVAKILSIMQFVPVRVECLFTTMNKIEYTGLSSKFGEIPEGTIIPEYKLQVHETEGEISDVTVEKIEYKIGGLGG